MSTEEKVIDVESIVEESINELDAFKQALKNPIFSIVYIGIGILLFVVITLLPLFLNINNNWIYLTMLIGVIFLSGVFYFVINPYMKQYVNSKYELETNPGRFKHWADTSYGQKKMVKLKDLLYKEILIEGHNKFNAERCFSIERSFKSSAQGMGYLNIVQVILGFIFSLLLVIWSNLITKVFAIDDLVRSLKYSMILLTVVSLTISYLSIILYPVFKALFESKKNKYIRMASVMRKLGYCFEYKNNVKNQHTD